MMKHEFEKLVGRQIPVEVYMEIETEYMKQDNDKTNFAGQWTAEMIDSLICKKFFDMNMKVLEAESKIEGYQNRIEFLNSRLQTEQSAKWNTQKENYELWDRIASMEEEIKGLKARLYDKQRGVA